MEDGTLAPVGERRGQDGVLRQQVCRSGGGGEAGQGMGRDLGRRHSAGTGFHEGRAWHPGTANVNTVQRSSGAAQ